VNFAVKNFRADWEKIFNREVRKVREVKTNFHFFPASGDSLPLFAPIFHAAINPAWFQ